MIKVFKDNLELAHSFCEELFELTGEKEKLFFVLSGGSTPKIIFQILANDYKGKIDWKKVHLFWGDERCVSPEDKESNYGMTKKILIDSIAIPDENIHRIKGENDPVEESRRYSEEVKKYVPFNNKFPLFDLVTLGIGEDGHVASIFPGQMNLINSEKICEVAVHPSSGQKRITLTGNVINNSRQIIFLITGKNKSTIVKELFEGKDKSKYPAGNIKPVHGKVEYYLDRDAAKLLTGN
ncbi:MAG TPA: 6-phosphogluconolactonase [Ignavibacteriaceae bacterium]